MSALRMGYMVWGDVPALGRSLSISTFVLFATFVGRDSKSATLLLSCLRHTLALKDN